MAAYCSNCAATLDPGVKFCASCGTPTESVRPLNGNATSADAPDQKTPPIGGKRYPALRLAAIVLKVMAVVWLVIGSLSIVQGISIGNDLPRGFGAGGALYGFVALLSFVGFAVMSWATAELLHVFMDIEENTRRTFAK